MSLLKRLFGGGGGGSAPAPKAQPVEHKGFRIFPEPVKEAAGYRIAARIELDANGKTRSHQMIRADVINVADDAIEASVGKAKQMIDQMGEALFG